MVSECSQFPVVLRVCLRARPGWGSLRRERSWMDMLERSFLCTVAIQLGGDACVMNEVVPEEPPLPLGKCLPGYAGGAPNECMAVL